MPSSPSMTKWSPLGSGPGDRLSAASAELLQELRRDFDRQHYVRLPGFFDRPLLDTITSTVADAEFAPSSYKRVGSEWTLKDDTLTVTLIWLLNTQELIRAVRRITGDDEIGFFLGRIYRLSASPDQSFDWHDDRHEDIRRVAVSVNLGERAHAGGVLQIREKATPGEIAEVPNVVRGDAVLFRVADHLQHRVTPVEGPVPRLALSGWFRAGPSYHSQILAQARSAT